jgi:hypothetical protein
MNTELKERLDKINQMPIASESIHPLRALFKGLHVYLGTEQEQYARQVNTAIHDKLIAISNYYNPFAN